MIGDLNFIVSEANILSINEVKNLLNIYYNKWKLDKKKIRIILNKINIFSINKNIIYKLLKFKNKIYRIKENKFFLIFLNNYYKINMLLKNKKIIKDIKNIIYEKEENNK